MSRRAKPPVSAWIVRERKRLGLKPHDLALRLTAMGLPVAEGTPRTWEAGRSPSPENIEGLERIFGTVAPDMDRPGDATPSGLSDLVVELRALVGELRTARQERDELRAELDGFREALLELGALRRSAPAGDPASGPHADAAIQGRRG